MSENVTTLTIETVPAYLASRTDLRDVIDAGTVTVREVGDGNLNLVFIATDAEGRGLVLKQSLPYVRMVGESWPLSQDRILAEARGYEVASRHAPRFAPRYHGLDEPNHLIVLEDLSGWRVWRRAANEGRVYPGAGRDLGEYVARIFFGTSVFGLPAVDLHLARAASANPELCGITEDLVFTEPYHEVDRNSWDEAITDTVHSLRSEEIRSAAALLKFKFVTAAQSYVHGDLHLGSVFVTDAPGRDVTAKAFDSEFGFYGPVAFDLGALIGNLAIAAVRGRVLGRGTDYEEHLLKQIEEFWTSFTATFDELWPQRVDTSFTDGLRDTLIAEIWQDAIGFAAAKAIRRIVGMAKVTDIQTLDEPRRVVAARAVLEIGRDWLLDRSRLVTVADLTGALREKLAGLAVATGEDAAVREGSAA